LTVTFINQSTGIYPNVLWGFGDGITSTSNDQTYLYAAGIYTVTLRVFGPGGAEVVTRERYITASVPKWYVYFPLLLTQFRINCLTL